MSEAPRIGIDPYLDWLEGEGIPVVEDFGVDLLKVETRPWARMGIDGAAVHLKGRGDFVSLFVLELAPGAATAPQRHLYEEVLYVLAGRGSTTVEAADGRKHTFEWGPRSLFAIPLNTRYRHFNGSGSEKALLSSTTNLPGVLNMFHNEAFVFDNPYRFNERMGAAKYFSGEGTTEVSVEEVEYVCDFEEGDKVVYPHHGAGLVMKKESRELMGEEREYLTIKILHNELTVMVPCENAGKAGLRRVIDEVEIKKVTSVLTDDVSEMPKNWNRRFKYNREKIKTGDVFELAEVVRNLAIREMEKGLSTGEKQMYTRAKKILASEFMYALDKDEEGAEEYLDGLLEERFAATA